MKSSRPKIVVVGSSNTDVVVRTPHLPAPGETVLASSMSTVQGGKGANQAVAAARLGADVVFVARVGDDGYGDAALAAFKADGIDTAYVTLDSNQPTGTAIIGVDETTGENSIFVVSGANGCVSVEDVESASSAIASADILVCQLEVPLAAIETALRIAHKAGVPSILNPSPVQPLSPEILKLVTVLVPNEGEAQLLAGETALKELGEIGEALRSQGVGTVLITLGKEGALLVDESGARRFPGVVVTEVVDTTGAGDCFTGALAVALAEGQGIERAVKFASAAAAISVTRAGAQPSLPYRNEVDRKLG